MNININKSIATSIAEEIKQLFHDTDRVDGVEFTSKHYKNSNSEQYFWITWTNNEIHYYVSNSVNEQYEYHPESKECLINVDNTISEILDYIYEALKNFNFVVVENNGIKKSDSSKFDYFDSLVTAEVEKIKQLIYTGITRLDRVYETFSKLIYTNYNKTLSLVVEHNISTNEMKFTVLDADNNEHIFHLENGCDITVTDDIKEFAERFHNKVYKEN